MSLWPFTPVNEVVEVLAWHTDVLRARSAEQRFRLRERPRRQWHFKHILTGDNQAAARAIVRGATSYQVPDWIRIVYSGPVSAGTSVSIAMTTAGYGLAAGASVVLWGGPLAYEVCVIESVSASALVLEYVTTPRTGIEIYRVDDAINSVELEITRGAGPVEWAAISFESPAVDVTASSTYSQYRGHDLLPVRPKVGSGELSDSVSYPREIFDNTSGLPTTTASRDIPDEKFMMRWHVITEAEIQSLREWIASRYGRWLAFWQSTFENDLSVAADITAIATTLRVFAPTGSTTLGRTAFDLEIETPSGVFYRRVTGVSAGPAVNGRPTFDLTIDSAFGSAVTAAAFGRVSYLRCARFDADRIELLHRPREGLAVAVPCIEVPVP